MSSATLQEPEQTGPSTLRTPDNLRRAAAATPPLLIGGVKQLQASQGRTRPVFHPWSAGIDYLTVTVPTDVDQYLRRCTIDHGPGNPVSGFAESEQRLTVGGLVWRRTKPHQPHKKWGHDYASWDCSGEPAAYIAPIVLPHLSRPSRQDYAFDFQVPSDFYPRDILPLIRDHLEAQDIEPHFAGPEKSCTVYLGSLYSDVRIKIYRRDLKDPGLELDGFPPQIRIEVTIKGLPGKALWEQRQKTGSDGLAMAATHIARMIGWAVYNDLEPLPPLSYSSEDADVSQQVFAFVKQNASMILAAHSSGIDLLDLAQAQRARFSRTTEWRHARRIESFARVNGSRIVTRVLDMLRGTFTDLEAHP